MNHQSAEGSQRNASTTLYNNIAFLGLLERGEGQTSWRTQSPIEQEMMQPIQFEPPIRTVVYNRIFQQGKIKGGEGGHNFHFLWPFVFLFAFISLRFQDVHARGVRDWQRHISDTQYRNKRRRLFQNETLLVEPLNWSENPTLAVNR